jgi:hypothetical protein
MKYRPRIESMISSLKSNPLVDVETAVLGPPADPELVSRLREAHRGHVPEEIFDFYGEVGSLELLWWAKLPEASRDDMSWSGRIKLVPLQAVVSADEWRDLLWFDGNSESHPFRLIRPVDFWVNEACAVLYPVPGDAKICYHYCGEELWPTGLTFDQWFDRLLASRGFWYWLKALIARPNGDAAHFRAVMPKVFPDFDPSLFVASDEPELY